MPRRSVTPRASSTAMHRRPRADAPAGELVAQLRRLRTSAERQRLGLCYVEGLGPVGQAFRAGAPIERCLVAPALLTASAERLLAELITAGVPTTRLAPSDLAAITFRRPSRDGLAALVRTRSRGLADLIPGPDDLWLALAGVGNPGNLGAVLRTCDAVACAGLLLLGDAVDPFHPAAVQASRGAAFTVPLARASVAELRAWAEAHHLTVVGTSPTAPVSYRAFPYPRRLLLLMGSERDGLTAAERALCHDVVRIPMAGRLDSLNLAVAAGILLYEAVSATTARSDSTCPGSSAT
jgi:TrmH family RNA methyltransferase